MAILFSDLHYFEFPQLSFLDAGINSRLRVASSVVNQVGDLAEELHDPDIWFLGDLQYERTGVSTIVAHEQARDFLQLKKRGFTVKVLAGNHDFAPGGETRHHLHTISKYARIIAKPWFDEALSIQWIPFTTDKVAFSIACEAAIKKDARCILTHNGFSSAKVVSNWSYFMEDIEAPDWIHQIPILSGHYHNTAKIGKHGRYLGAPLQLNWGDEGIEKFIWQLRTDAPLSLKPYKIHTPKFHTFDVSHEEDLLRYESKIKGNFIRLKIPRKFPFRPSLLKQFEPHAIAQPVYKEDEREQQMATQQVHQLQKLVSQNESIEKFLCSYAKNLATRHGKNPKKLFSVLRPLLTDT